MAVYVRKDSPWLYFHNEVTGKRSKTQFKKGVTADERKKNLAAATLACGHTMRDDALRESGYLPAKVEARPTIGFREYAVDTYGKDVAPTRKGAEREAEIIKTLVRFFGDTLIHLIDKDAAGRYETHRTAKGVSNSTINREVSVLKAIQKCAAPKYFAEPPLKGRGELRRQKPKHRIMGAEEETGILAVANQTERAYLLLCMDGLLRQKDALYAKRSDREGIRMHVPDPKTGTPYSVVLTDRLIAALDAIPSTHDSYFRTLWSPSSTPSARRSGVTEMFKRLCRRAGVPYGRNTLGGLTWHKATRATGATRLVVDRRLDIPSIMRQGNWKKPDVLLEIYAQADSAAQERAIRGFTAGSQSTENPSNP